MFSRMFRDADLRRLEAAAHVVTPTVIDGDALKYPSLADTRVLITGWGSPLIDQGIVSAAPQLKLIAHSAGSIKNIVRELVSTMASE
jgi:hypothetical protein